MVHSQHIYTETRRHLLFFIYPSICFKYNFQVTIMWSSILAVSAIFAAIFLESSAELKGHLKPLGSHQDPVGGIPVTGKFPSPWVFYQEFVLPGKPLVMKKVLEKDNIPAYRLWTDDYLRYNHNQLLELTSIL